MPPLDKPSSNFASLEESGHELSQEAWSLLDQGKTVVEALGSGTVKYGLESLKENPGGFAVETFGGACLGLALKGPAWIKAPALLSASLGGMTAGLEARAALRDSAAILKNSTGSEEPGAAKEALEQVLGPVAFNGMSMYLSGNAASRLAHRLPLKPNWGEKFDLESIVPGGGMQKPQLAFAYGHSGTKAAEVFQGKSFRESEMKPSESLIYNSVGHGAGKGSEAQITYGRGTQGEALQRVEQLLPGETAGFHHQDGTLTQISQAGKVAVEFPSGEGRVLELGKEVRHIVSHEFGNGLKQYRVNGASVANLEVSNERHVMRAVLGNGDHLHLGDNVPGGFVHFAHRDGLQSWVEYNGKLTFQLPGGQVSSSNLGRELAHIKLLEFDGGGAQFRFLDAQGRLLPEVVKLPSLTQTSVLQNERIARDLRNNLQGRQRNYYAEEMQRSQGNYQPEFYEEAQHTGGPFWEANWPSDIERGYAKVLAGVDNRIMRGNDLTSPADMALAQQNHNWLVKRYLAGLNK